MSWLPEDETRLRIILGFSFGFAVLGVYFTLAMSIGLGKVDKESSFGLDLVLQALGPLGGLFAGWAFGMVQSGKANDK